MECYSDQITTIYVGYWDKDRKLQYWLDNGLSLEIAEDYLLFEEEVLCYRRSLPKEMNTTKIYWNSIEQLEERVKWLKKQIRIKKSRLYIILHKKG